MTHSEVIARQRSWTTSQNYCIGSELCNLHSQTKIFHQIVNCNCGKYGAVSASGKEQSQIHECCTVPTKNIGICTLGKISRKARQRRQNNKTPRHNLTVSTGINEQKSNLFRLTRKYHHSLKPILILGRCLWLYTSNRTQSTLQRKKLNTCWQMKTQKCKLKSWLEVRSCIRIGARLWRLDCNLLHRLQIIRHLKQSKTSILASSTWKFFLG